MRNEIPDNIKEQLISMPEYKYGISRVRVTLVDDRVFHHVHIAWANEVVRVEGYTDIPFDSTKIVKIENDLL